MFKKPSDLTKDVTLRIDIAPTLLDKIDQYALDNGTKTRSSAVRELLRAGLAAEKEK